MSNLSDLPAHAWVEVPNDSAAYNYRTRMNIVSVGCEVLLDGGAGVNSVAEEEMLGAINVARASGIGPKDPRYPVLQLEKWPTPECVTWIDLELNAS